MRGMRIGALASLSGTNSPTIRYYEAIGLLPPAGRQNGGQRTYGREDLERLQFVRRCRDFGFGIEEVRGLLPLLTDRSTCCTDARDVAAKQLARVRQKMRELRELELRLGEFVRSCDEQCAGGPGPDCVILDDLAKRPVTPVRKGCC